MNFHQDRARLLFFYPHCTERKTGDQENTLVSPNKIGRSGLKPRCSDFVPIASSIIVEWSEGEDAQPVGRGDRRWQCGQGGLPSSSSASSHFFLRLVWLSLLLIMFYAGSICMPTLPGKWRGVNPFVWSHLLHQLPFSEFVCWASRFWEWNG